MALIIVVSRVNILRFSFLLWVQLTDYNQIIKKESLRKKKNSLLHMKCNYVLNGMIFFFFIENRKDAFRVYYWGTTAPESQYKQVSIFVHDSMIRKKKKGPWENFTFLVGNLENFQWIMLKNHLAHKNLISSQESIVRIQEGCKILHKNL